MADNVPITAGSGTNIATDEVTGTLEHVQLVKLAISTDGSRTLVPADATNGIDVDVTRVTGTVAVGDATNSVLIHTSSSDGESNTVNRMCTEGHMMSFNGTTWDRVRGDTTNGVDVDVTRLPALAAGTNYVGKVVVGNGTNDVAVSTSFGDTQSNTQNALIVDSHANLFNGTTWDRMRGDITNGLDVDVTRVPAPLSTSGNGTAATALRVTVASDSTGVVGLNTGTNTVGNVGLATRTSGGMTTYHLVSAATTNATNVKASAGQLYGWYIYNNAAGMRKVAFHNTAGTPTAGASIFFTINVPANSAANVFSDIGIAFSTGIGITTVTDVTDAGTTAVSLNDLTINLFYA